MIIQVLQKQFEYEGCPIVIRRVGEKFEYITCINNLIYSSFVEARLSIFAKLLGTGYTDKQIHKITNYVISLAQTTIDTVKGNVANKTS